MSYLRYVPTVCILGAVIGFISYTQLWVHVADGFPWLENLTGAELINCDWGGFQAYIPTIMVVLSVMTIAVAFMTMTIPGFWFGSFICLIFGVAIMALTSVFSMWTVDGEKIIHFVDTGFWLSYAAGAVILIGVAIHYSVMFKKPAKQRARQ